MAVTSFIPKLWASRLLAGLEKSHVALAFVNRDYEGEIKKLGDTVHVNSIGAITVRDYTKGTPIQGPEELSTTDQTLVIDQAKYFNFAVDDIDKVQAAGPLMDSAMRKAAYGIADVVDTKIFTEMGTAAGTKITGPSDAAIYVTATTAYDYLVDLATALTKKNAPKVGRKVAISPEFHGLLLKDPRFVSSGNDSAEERLQNGFVGRAAGFDVYESNNLPVGIIIAATNEATSFAEQIVEIEAYRPESAFADAVKGLNVYGVKVFVPDAIATLKYTLTNE